MEKSVKGALERAGEYLLKRQEQNGSWTLREDKHMEPGELQKDIVLTAQNTLALLMSGTGTFNAINKGINFCAEYGLDSKDPLAWWARKLMALALSNSELNRKQKAETVAFLKKQQDEGRWQTVMSTYSLTNQMIIEGLSFFNEPRLLAKSGEWFRANMAADRKGWGKDTESKSEYTFTANVITALMDCGESPAEDYIMTARAFLEGGQEKNGSWSSSKATVEKPTVYATAVAALALMLTSENPFNEKIRKALEFVIRNQSGTGGWPNLPKEKPKSYVTYYAVKTLAFNLYLSGTWEGAEARFLRKRLKPQEVSAYLFKRFKKHLTERYRELAYASISSSSILGTNKNAIERRKDILAVLGSEGSKETAEVIDSLKKQEKYAHLNKKAHMTQIKYDLQQLHGLNLVGKVRDKYFLVFNPAA